MIKILIVDDQNFTRQALQAILEQESDLEVVGKVNSGSEAIKYLENLEQIDVDIVMVDLEMPNMSGIALTKILAQRFIKTKVIILSSNAEEEKINAAVESGARGYLLKETCPQEISDTIRAVQKGYFQLGPGLFEKLLSHLIKEKEQAVENLTQLKHNYTQSILELEQKIIARNEAERAEIYQELELQILNLKQDFRQGLENFQSQVSQQLQNGIEATNARFNSFIPDIHKVETQIEHRYLEQQRHINTLLTSNKLEIKKIENQVDSIRYSVIFLGIIFFIVGTGMLILY